MMTLANPFDAEENQGVMGRWICLFLLTSVLNLGILKTVRGDADFYLYRSLGEAGDLGTQGYQLSCIGDAMMSSVCRISETLNSNIERQKEISPQDAHRLLSSFASRLGKKPSRGIASSTQSDSAPETLRWMFSYQGKNLKEEEEAGVRSVNSAALMKIEAELVRRLR
jgi:hypothetical protein